MHIEPAHEKGFFDSILGRQVEPNGLVGWLTTVDHKRIGILYGVTALIWFIVGGLEALAIRVQLHRPEMRDFITPEVYNQLFTMHGTTMIFLVVMPLAVAFFNFIVPLQIGAR
ncbi:MAG: cbb3-type cytochrome c oxidase subunit I, partial [Candidatus Eremiobacteraeota bacterium]|nr:cbb3-type cytochrome c oxidase subunit I [Candidatus Eremiobacteraeota bacterium]